MPVLYSLMADGDVPVLGADDGAEQDPGVGSDAHSPQSTAVGAT
jgi:hypothetical protein